MGTHQVILEGAISILAAIKGRSRENEVLYLQKGKHCRARGLAVACSTYEPEARAIYHVNLTVPLFVFIGGERRGISWSMLRAGDLLLQAPYGGDFKNALSAASAAAVIAFEVLRQRMYV